jgi:hypothetical protein
MKTCEDVWLLLTASQSHFYLAPSDSRSVTCEIYSFLNFYGFLCSETDRADIHRISVGLWTRSRVMQLFATCYHGDCFRTVTFVMTSWYVQNATAITLNFTSFCFYYQMIFNCSYVCSFSCLFSFYVTFFLALLLFFYRPMVYFNFVHAFFSILSFSFIFVFSSFSVFIPAIYFLFLSFSW